MDSSPLLLRVLKCIFAIALLSRWPCIQVCATLEGTNIKRSDFPSDFLFGVSTAAAQIEGSVHEDGKGESIWENFIRKYPGKIMDHSNMNTAIDSYRRFKEDVKALKDLGVDSYRFSIPWTRILPTGSLSDGVNQEGIDHYNKLIDELLDIGIKPFVTLLHFDPPQALEDKYGGFRNRSIVDDFKDFCEVCFKEFGDRVEHWVTINEPLIMAQMGYDLGVAAPGRCSPPWIAGECSAGNSSIEPYIVAHNILLSHATASKLYKQKYQRKQRGEIGISLVGKFFEPYSESQEDKESALRLLDFELGWFMEPLVFGDYPKSMKALVNERLPIFSHEDSKLVKGSFDFIGINYYTSRYAKTIPPGEWHPPRFTFDSLATQEIANKKGVPIGPKAEGSSFIYIYPEGLHKLLMFMKKAYRNPKIYITENGISEANERRGRDLSLKDPHRITNTLRHLYMINAAMKNGVKVRGYFMWALFDDFEWGEGFIPRFGLYYVDYEDGLKRFPKMSAMWLPDFLSGIDKQVI